MQCRYCTKDNDYLVFADGNVYSRRSQKMLRPGKTTDGYYTIGMCHDGKRRTEYIHHIVAEAFIPNPENKPCINHINGNKLDNRVENLEWCTYSENNLHAVYTGLHHPYFGVKPIAQYTRSGILIATYPSSRIASKQTKVSQGNISEVCSGKRKTAGGYIWKYME